MNIRIQNNKVAQNDQNIWDLICWLPVVLWCHFKYCRVCTSQSSIRNSITCDMMRGPWLTIKERHLVQGFLFYTFSENRRAPGAHFAWVFGYSLEFFLKVAWVFSRLLEFPEKINYFMQILEGKCSFFARFAQFLSNFGLNIHKKCLLLLKKCWDFLKKNCHVLKISRSLGFLKK